MCKLSRTFIWLFPLRALSPPKWWLSANFSHCKFRCNTWRCNLSQKWSSNSQYTFTYSKLYRILVNFTTYLSPYWHSLTYPGSPALPDDNQLVIVIVTVRCQWHHSKSVYNTLQQTMKPFNVMYSLVTKARTFPHVTWDFSGGWELMSERRLQQSWSWTASSIKKNEYD